MLTIEVELLTGKYVATAHDDRKRAEWPPHPARFFSALVAAHYEGGTGTAPDPLEREVLQWLEAQPPPSMTVDVTANVRGVLDVFVPVNDITTVGDIEKPLREQLLAFEKLKATDPTPADLKKAEKEVEKARQKLALEHASFEKADPKPSASGVKTAAALLPDRRTRQVRTFPVAIPEQSVFSMTWSGEVPAHLKTSLGQLCERVTRLGHSSSLVWCRPVERHPPPTLVPTPHGELVLRTVGAGQLERLDAAWSHHQGIETRLLPSRPQRYGAPLAIAAASAPHTSFSSEWIVFERVGGGRILGSRGPDLARALRASLLEVHGVAGMPESLSGHDASGKPTAAPHVSFIALPYVGPEFADGSVKGCAIVTPREMSDADHELLLKLIARWEAKQPDHTTVTLGGYGLPEVQLRRVETSVIKSNHASLWSKPAHRFLTATPIALDRNPGNLRSNLSRTAHKAADEAQRSIADACENIGLPRPVGVEISFAPVLRGAQPAGAFQSSPARLGRPPRVRVHAEIRFAEPVRGPVVLGAGRHFGLGLCLPVGGE